MIEALVKKVTCGILAHGIVKMIKHPFGKSVLPCEEKTINKIVYIVYTMQLFLLVVISINCYILLIANLL